MSGKRFPKTSASAMTAFIALVASLMMASVVHAAGDPVLIRTPHRGSRPMQLDLHGGFTHLGVGPAVGSRFSIPIVKNGFVPPINNAVYISFGADFYWVKVDRDEYAATVGFPITMRWEFTFTTRWSAFGEIGVNIFLHPDLIKDDDWRWAPGHWVVACVGGQYHISKTVALILRLGNPYSAFGVNFKF